MAKQSNDKRWLLRDSSGKPSWTITFCAVAMLMLLAWFCKWLIEPDTDYIKGVGEILLGFAGMTIAPLVARVITNKINNGKMERMVVSAEMDRPKGA